MEVVIITIENHQEMTIQEVVEIIEEEAILEE
jgi:hypothetical protein